MMMMIVMIMIMMVMVIVMMMMRGRMTTRHVWDVMYTVMFDLMNDI